MMLNTDTVYTLLQQNNSQTPYKLHFYDSLDSTNTKIKSLPAEDNILVCCAETQTSGRGRFGRTWHSPVGENIYCSVKWPFSKPVSHLSGLSLVIALAVIATLQELGFHQDIGIKWPNDILWQGKKLAGILIETQGVKDLQVIIGIGMNINTDTEKNSLSDKEWTSLFSMSGEKIDRNIVLAFLLGQLEKYIPVFIEQGLQPFLADFAQFDWLCGKSVHLLHNNKSLQGTALGLHNNGALLLKDAQGHIHQIASGEASLKIPDNL